MTVFEAKVREEGITDFRLIDPLEIKEQTYRDGRQYFSFGAYRDLSMRMLGVHQYENAVAALLGAEAFFRRHTELRRDKRAGRGRKARSLSGDR